MSDKSKDIKEMLERIKKENCDECDRNDPVACGGECQPHYTREKLLKNIEILITNRMRARLGDRYEGKPDYNRIKCAAIRKGDKIISGYRHDDCYKNLTMLKVDEEHWTDYEQGFINLNNKFLTREEAAKIAFKKGQIIEETDMLFSEDLY